MRERERGLGRGRGGNLVQVLHRLCKEAKEMAHLISMSLSWENSQCLRFSTSMKPHLVCRPSSFLPPADTSRSLPITANGMYCWRKSRRGKGREGEGEREKEGERGRGKGREGEGRGIRAISSNHIGR